MDYMTFMNQVGRGWAGKKGVCMMCSGEDMHISNRVFEDIVRNAKDNPVIIMDDAGLSGGCLERMQQNFGYKVHNALSGSMTLYNILQLDSIRGRGQLRELVGIAGYSELDKQKIISFLSFVKHLERLSGNDNTVLTYKVLACYSSNRNVEMKLQTLLDERKITQEEREYLLAKYSEVSSVAADFENLLLSITPFITGSQLLSDVLIQGRQAVYVPVYLMGQDCVMKNMAASLVSYALGDVQHRKHSTVILLDNGRSDRAYFSNVLRRMMGNNCDVHCISRDIFTVDRQVKELLENSMDVKIYSRHLSMTSCEEIEHLLGDVDVVKTTYGVDYPRQWKANSAWDILFGNNKTEHYTQNAAVREPRYRKESINSFLPGMGIIDFHGNTSIFNL